MQRNLQKADHRREHHNQKTPVERARLIENLARLFALHFAIRGKLDRYIFGTWEHQRKANLLRKVIGDFCGSNRSVPKYTKAFDKLLKELQKE